jgi:hypothetical protein
MSSRKQRKRRKLILVVVCFFLFAIGYYFLNEVSTWFEVPLGVTFHVIFGCTLMASSGIYIVYTINRLYFTKRAKRTKHIYLKDNPDEKPQ